MADGLIDDRFQDASCAYALQKFGLDNFREKQLLALKDLILGRDALVISLPTGFETCIRSYERRFSIDCCGYFPTSFADER